VDRDALSGTDFAVEAASERFELKAEIFQALDRILPQSAVLATNTSSISITKLAAQTAARLRSSACTFSIPCRS